MLLILRPYAYTSASIWFEIWGVVDPDQNNFDFSRQISEKFRLAYTCNFTENIDFSRQIPEKFRFLQAISLKTFEFSRQISEKCRFLRKFKKFRFFRQKLAIYSYLLANYSISL